MCWGQQLTHSLLVSQLVVCSSPLAFHCLSIYSTGVYGDWRVQSGYGNLIKNEFVIDPALIDPSLGESFGPLIPPPSTTATERSVGVAPQIQQCECSAKDDGWRMGPVPVHGQSHVEHKASTTSTGVISRTCTRWYRVQKRLVKNIIISRKVFQFVQPCNRILERYN